LGRVSRLSPMEGFWPIFFLLVVLKIPVFGALWLVWWASKAPEVDGETEDSGGGFKRHRPFPTRPRGPHHLPGGGSAVARRRRGAPLRALNPAGQPVYAPAESRADKAGSPPESCDA
jgi:hypothetical protein